MATYLPNVSPFFQAAGDISKGDGTQEITNDYRCNRTEYHLLTPVLFSQSSV
jgi:hypothetical protein